jgi:hypothetical protein
LAAVTGLRLDVVADADEFADLRGEWADAAAADPDATAFLTWPWASTWWRHAGREGDALHVVVVRDGGGVAALLPLYRTRAGRGRGPLGLTALRSLGADAGDYANGGALLARHEPQAVELIVNHLGAQLRSGVGVVVLSRLARRARFTALLGDELVRHAATVETVVSRSDGTGDAPPPFDLDRLARAHAELALVTHTGATVESGLDRLAELASGPAPASDFLADAVRALDAEGAVRLVSLEDGGRPVAVQLDLVHGGRVSPVAGAVDGSLPALTRPEGPVEHTTVTLSRPGLLGALARQRVSRRRGAGGRHRSRA